MKRLSVLWMLLLVIPLFALNLTARANEDLSPFYSVKAKSIDGKEFDFKKLQGKVTLIVNTASQCGFTPQLADLEEIHKKYGPKGLVVIAVPSSDFKQELASSAEALSFAEKNYKTTFTFLDKQIITGDNKSPLFKYLTEKKKNLVFKEVQWNFEKFLVGRDGEVIERWSSVTKPSSTSIVSSIEKALQDQPKSGQ